MRPAQCSRSAGRTLGHYWAALTLLGVGWNLLFVAATTLLTRTYRSSERFRAQTVNDFVMFGTMAVTSLAAGPLMDGFGWRGIVAVALLLLTALVLGVTVMGLRRRLPAARQAG